MEGMGADARMHVCTDELTPDVHDVGDPLQGTSKSLVQRRDVLQAQLGRAVQIDLCVGAWGTYVRMCARQAKASRSRGSID